MAERDVTKDVAADRKERRSRLFWRFLRSKAGLLLVSVLSFAAAAVLLGFMTGAEISGESDDANGSKRGILYYPPKTYFMIKRDTSHGRTEATDGGALAVEPIFLPDLAYPQRLQLRAKMTKLDVKLALKDGWMLTGLGVDVTPERQLAQLAMQQMQQQMQQQMKGGSQVSRRIRAQIDAAGFALVALEQKDEVLNLRLVEMHFDESVSKEYEAPSTKITP